MLQAVQYQKTGEVLIEEFPVPECHRNGVLIKTVASLISVGTEKASVKSGQSSLIQRAKAQPDQVKQVYEYFKKEGLKSTINKVLSKLDSYKQFGYSAAGIVVESTCDEFKPGDSVAVGGAQIATHSEYISAPKNLTVKIPDGVSFNDAAYTTVGSIAMQGARQADMRLGETVVVLGLGLLGLITVQLMKASGCRVIGMDINDSNFELAKKFGCDAVFISSKDASNQVKAQTRGLGADAVIITASSGSNEPLEISLDLARKKGKVIVVGAIAMDVPRSPFYEKEIDIRISCSYGPGRYDSAYEDDGIDYPAPYVRWSENRNMQSILDLVQAKTLDVNTLTTHKFNIEAAQSAYKLILSGEEKSIGVILEYPDNSKSEKTISIPKNKVNPSSDIKIGFIGAGAFAQSSLLPHIKTANCAFTGVTTATPANAKAVAGRWGFEKASTDSMGLIEDKNVNLLFCASKHDSHAKYVLKAIECGKPIFVEKPLAINEQEFGEIESALQKKGGRVMVGFNRRFSKPFEAINKFFAERRDPMTIIYRVNAGFIPKNHWIQNSEQGGRIVGEACHFIDCMIYLTKALPVKIYAESITSDNAAVMNADNVSINIKFSDGSIGTVIYASSGDSSVEKEYCEVYAENSTAIMKNFKSVEFYRAKKMTKAEYDGTKGHKEEVLASIKAIRDGKDFPISFEEIKGATLATFAAVESLNSGVPVRII